MHTDLSPHLHSQKCNDIIQMLYKCREEHAFGKFFGACNYDYNEMTKCLKEERLQRRQRNWEKSLETKARFRRLCQEEREREKQNS